MKLYTPSLLAAAALVLTFAIVPQPALTAGKGKKSDGDAAGTSKAERDREALIGEITSGTESALELRPWNPKLPRRVTVETGPGTRYLQQKKGRWADLQVGDAVLVMPITPTPPTPATPAKEGETTPTPTEEDEEAETSEEQEQLRRPAVRAVLRLWPAGEAGVSEEETKTARALLRAATPYFKIRELGGVGLPRDDDKPVIGVLTALMPLTVRTERRTRRFTVRKEILVVNHQPVTRAEMKRGRTVIVRSDEPASLKDSIPATLVTLCPERKLSPRQTRLFLLREERKSSPSSKKP